MADGIRILENGDVRVTESSDNRITENYVAIDATASLGGVGTLTASAGGSSQAQASLAGLGTLSALGGLTFPATGSLSADGTLTASANVLFVLQSSASLSASGTLGASTTVKQSLFGTATLGGSSSITATSVIRGIKYATFGKASGVAIRDTEASDQRITEQGDIRIVNEINNGSAVGYLNATATLDRFSGESYVKDAGTWKETRQFVKYGGNWQAPAAVYKNINGNWKRVY